LRVLFVNHTGTKSGAEISLIDLVVGMPSEVHGLVACPEGELAEILRARGVDVHPIPAIEASLRLHPVQTPVGVAQILRSALAVQRGSRRHQADIVHANSVRAGLAATVAAAAGGPRLLVHVRDCLPTTRAANLTRALIDRGASMVLANSRYTAENFARSGDRTNVTVAHSPVDLERFYPDRFDRAQARAELNLGPEPVLAVVAQITPWKGQATAIEALALLKERGLGARLLLVGGVKYDNAAYLRSLRQLVRDLRLQEDVTFVGDRADVPEVLRAIDVLLVPSWEEPFGRSVVEAMAMETPVIATCVGGPAEVIEDGSNGRLVEPRKPEAWSRAIEELLADPDLQRTMGQAGRRTAMRFDRPIHVEKVMAAYRRTLSSAR
jgi:glycosyltransferase involved in cell wall biosynthesis